MSRFFVGIVVAVAACLGDSPTPAPALPWALPRGLAPARNYSFEEIGPISAGLTLGSDALGRITVAREGIYLVFDDSAWTEILSRTDPHRNLVQTCRGPDGTVYTGNAGDWGELDYTSTRSARVISFRPEDCPDQLVNNTFTEIVPARDGVLYAGVSGGVFRWSKTGKQRLINLYNFGPAFALGGKVYFSLEQKRFTPWTRSRTR